MPFVELTVEQLVAGGDGLAREPDGRVVFVRGAAPGDRVRAELVDQRRDFARADIVEVVEPGPDRVVPPCPHVDRGCGGCGWQHVDPAAARAHKAALVAEAFRRIGRLDIDVAVGPTVPVGGHRTTVRAVADGDGRLGLRRARSHDVVPLDSCDVAHPLVEEVIAGARLDGTGEVTVRCSPTTGERLALVHGEARLVGAPPDLRIATEASGGSRALHHVVAGRTFRVSAASFFQTSQVGAEALVEVVGAAISGAPEGPLVDLYGGVGLFAGTVGRGRQVVLVESSDDATADAVENLGPGAVVVDSRVEDWEPVAAAVVIADPPRSGLRATGVEAVRATGAPDVVLVSCDAAAAARDVCALSEVGYRVRSSAVVDLFPFTPHVEVVSHLARAEEP